VRGVAARGRADPRDRHGHHTAEVDSVAFSSDGRWLATGSADKTVRIWASGSFGELFSLRGYAGPVGCLAFSPDSQRLASGSSDGIKLWNLATTGERFAIVDPGLGPRRWAEKVAFSPDGRKIAASDGRTTGIVDSFTGEVLLTLRCTDGPSEVPWAWASDLAFSPDGRFIAAGSCDGAVRVWNVATGQEGFAFRGHTGCVNSVAFSSDSRRLASGGADKCVRVWDAAAGTELFTLKGHAEAVTSAAYSPDGRRLASASWDKTVRVWDAATGEELLAFKGHTDQVYCLAFSPDGQRLASGGRDRTVLVWDASTGKEQLVFRTHADQVVSVAFSPDGRRIASGSDDKTLRIWDAASGKDFLTLRSGPVSWSGRVTSLAFSPDGRRLAACMGNGIKLWEAGISGEIEAVRGAEGLVHYLMDRLLLRSQVIEHLQNDRSLKEVRRQAAIAIARAQPEDATKLNNHAWDIVKAPGRDAAVYRSALRYIEEACSLEPENGDYVNTLGLAYYRVGEYRKVLETLTRSDKINTANDLSRKNLNAYATSILQTHPIVAAVYSNCLSAVPRAGDSDPTDLAFLAMTHYRLGNKQTSKAEFSRLQGRMKDPRWAKDAEVLGFFCEAEALLKAAPGTSKE
jgi:WD40 repeat protein